MRRGVTELSQVKGTGGRSDGGQRQSFLGGSLGGRGGAQMRRGWDWTILEEGIWAGHLGAESRGGGVSDSRRRGLVPQLERRMGCCGTRGGVARSWN